MTKKAKNKLVTVFSLFMLPAIILYFIKGNTYGMLTMILILLIFNEMANRFFNG